MNKGTNKDCRIMKLGYLDGCFKHDGVVNRHKIAVVERREAFQDEKLYNAQFKLLKKYARKGENLFIAKNEISK